jgi:hypothetical protein
MSLDPLSDWKAAIDALPAANSTPAGTLNLANAISELEDKVQAGSKGSPGILTTNSSLFAAGLAAMAPTSGTGWVDTIVSAWQAALTASSITPSTVNDPTTWVASSTDTLTLAVVPATITTLSSAVSELRSELMELAASFQGGGDPAIQQNATEKFAGAFRKAVLKFKFNCIGLVVATPPTPLLVAIDAK